MGLKLLCISLALFCNRLSTAIPLVPHNSGNVFHSVSSLYDLRDFKHPYFHNGVESSRAKEQSEFPVDNSFESLPDTNGVRDLAAHHILWLESPERFPQLSKKIPFSWIEDGKKYRSLKENERTSLQDYLRKHVSKNPKQKGILEDIEWFMLQEPTWWDENFIRKSLDNNQYKKLVAIGNALKFHEKDAKLSQDDIAKEIYPKLQKFIGANKNTGGEELKLRLLADVKDERKQPILAKRIQELEKFSFASLEGGGELMAKLKDALNTSPPRRLKVYSNTMPLQRASKNNMP